MTEAAKELQGVEVFICDDDEAIRDSLELYLTSQGMKVRCAINPIEALEILKTQPANIIISDVRMPKMDGIEFLEELSEKHPDTDVIMITGHSNEELAISALRHGAFDYFKKPLQARNIMESLRRAHRFQLLKRENSILKQRIELKEKQQKQGGAFFGESPSSKQLKILLGRVSQVPDTTVLLAGETGTGKEVAARFIHETACGKKAPFIAFNCGAIAENLLESELFGHEKGAFTGADKRRQGIFELAEGGTVFLDEISEMSSAAQSRFLRVLQERSLRRIGGSVEIPLKSIRIIAATNRDLQEEVKLGNFREDLYYRINVAQINLPPLRDRREDIIPLAQLFLQELSRRYRRELNLAADASKALYAYNYPGNIRELRNLIERAAVFALGPDLHAADLAIPGAVASLPESPSTTIVLDQEPTLKLCEHERALIIEARRRSEGNHSAAARALGVTPQALYRKMEKHKID